jgi:hypothetical protein
MKPSTVIDIHPGRGITITTEFCKTYVYFGLTKQLIIKMLGDPSFASSDGEYIAYDDFGIGSFAFAENRLISIEMEAFEHTALRLGDDGIGSNAADVIAQFAKMSISFGDKIHWDVEGKDEYYFESKDNSITLYVNSDDTIDSIGVSARIDDKDEWVWP